MLCSGFRSGDYPRGYSGRHSGVNALLTGLVRFGLPRLRYAIPIGKERTKECLHITIVKHLIAFRKNEGVRRRVNK